jgi:hypothetical protein
MTCQLCRNLEAAFAARRNEYLEAASEACYVVTKRFAAYLNVEMERARIELQDHRSICRFIVSDATALPLTSLLRRPQQELLRRGTLGTAA